MSNLEIRPVSINDISIKENELRYDSFIFRKDNIDSRLVNFIHKGLKKSIKLYKSDNNLCMYSIFNYYFLVYSFDKKDNFSYDSFFAFYRNNEISDSDISLLLRDSNTFVQNDKNSYINTDIKVFFDNKKFIVTDNFTGSKNYKKFERTLIMFLIMQAYINVMSGFLDSIIDNISDFHKINNIINDFYIFHLKFFYENPVLLQKSRQCYDIFDIMADSYKLRKVYNEVMNKIIYFEKKNKYNLSVQSQLQKDMEHRREKKISLWLSIIGLILAATSLISAVKDLKEFFNN